MAHEEEVTAPGEAVAASAAADDTNPALEQAQAKAEENWNLYLRAQAEMDNLRKRAEKDLENAHKYALERFALELLPVKDSLELGLAAVEGDSEGALAKLREGTELTLRMLTAALEKYGVVEVNPLGEPFNPDRHQAITMQESAEAKPNTVLTVMQKGYLLNERVIRPALVVVAKAPA